MLVLLTTISVELSSASSILPIKVRAELDLRRFGADLTLVTDSCLHTNDGLVDTLIIKPSHVPLITVVQLLEIVLLYHNLVGLDQFHRFL